MKYSIELIKYNPEQPHLIHNCTRGKCKHKGQYKLHYGHQVVQVCLPHASEFCKRHNLHLPTEKDTNE